MTRLRWSSENEVASPVGPSTLSPSQPLASRKRASAVERALSGSPLSSIAVVMAAITPPSVFVVVMAAPYPAFLTVVVVPVDRQSACDRWSLLRKFWLHSRPGVENARGH